MLHYWKLFKIFLFELFCFHVNSDNECSTVCLVFYYPIKNISKSNYIQNTLNVEILKTIFIFSKKFYIKKEKNCTIHYILFMYILVLKSGFSS